MAKEHFPTIAQICTDTKQATTVLASKLRKCSLQEGVKPTEPAADINFKTTSRLSNKEWRYYASVPFRNPFPELKISPHSNVSLEAVFMWGARKPTNQKESRRSLAAC